MNQIINMIIEGFNSILEAPVETMLKNAIGQEQLDSIIKFLHLASTSAAGEPDYASFYSIINGIFDIMKPLGFALIATYFVVHMIDSLSKDAVTLEGFIKSLISLVLIISVAANSAEIMNAVFTLGETMLDMAKAAGNVGVKNPSINDIIKQTANSLVQTYGVGSLLIAGAIYLVHQFVVIGIDVAAFSRLIDIGWRAACMPVGLANSFEGGVNSSGVRYFKAFVSAIVAGAVMYIVCLIGFTLCASILQTSQNALVGNYTMKGSMTLICESIAIEFATMGAAMSAPQKTKELFS